MRGRKYGVHEICLSESGGGTAVFMSSVISVSRRRNDVHELCAPLVLTGRSIASK
ncbi:hypothetical protein [Paenibacillus sp. J45TS6]|uniref:hypothetical protein n=1 Tax=Paenibacillus sp. J45TS6 TaxID=2807196 RepID=UPI001BCBF946|nr:hypothetical protein [Paenibacillus sp. J45TS6]